MQAMSEAKSFDKLVNRALKHQKIKEWNYMKDYQVRMVKEYQDLKERYNKLHKMIVKYDAGTLEFTPTCPIELLRKQKSLMGQYLNVLEIRAEIEGINLEYKMENVEE